MKLNKFTILVFMFTMACSLPSRGLLAAGRVADVPKQTRSVYVVTADELTIRADHTEHSPALGFLRKGEQVGIIASFDGDDQCGQYVEVQNGLRSIRWYVCADWLE